MKKKKHLNKKKIVIILVLIVILIISIWQVAARYQSSGSGIGEIDIAMYVIEEGYQSMNLNLGKMVPRAEPYTYNFSVSNFKENARTDVDIEYTLKIKTTTNIPLTYELYLNENYNNPDAEDIILTNVVEQDQYETYFRNISANPREFSYQQNQTDEYQLAVYFPIVYKDIAYQNFIESVEIIVESKQILEETEESTAP